MRPGIYLINDLVQIFGPVRRVQVLGTHLSVGRPTMDSGQLAMEFANGALGNAYASFCVRGGDRYRDGLTLNFERGTVCRNVGLQRVIATMAASARSGRIGPVQPGEESAPSRHPAAELDDAAVAR
jgi:predicted dehydrogenase